MLDCNIVIGDGNRVLPTAHARLRERYSTLRRDHRQTLDLLELQDTVVAELRANLLTVATLAVQFAGQIERAGQQAECEPEALALADSVVQEQHDCEWSAACGSACNADEGE